MTWILAALPIYWFAVMIKRKKAAVAGGPSPSAKAAVYVVTLAL